MKDTMNSFLLDWFAEVCITYKPSREKYTDVNNNDYHIQEKLFTMNEKLEIVTYTIMNLFTWVRISDF